MTIVAPVRSDTHNILNSSNGKTGHLHGEGICLQLNRHTHSTVPRRAAKYKILLYFYKNKFCFL
jgi:hypothetical protein